MIKIQILRRKDGMISGFTVSGHHGKYGSDIVCAGISSLAQAALLGLGEHLHRELDYHVASGDLKMHLKGAPDDLTEAILETMLKGMKAIAAQYSQGVRIQEKQEVES